MTTHVVTRAGTMRTTATGVLVVAGVTVATAGNDATVAARIVACRTTATAMVGVESAPALHNIMMAAMDAAAPTLRCLCRDPW